ncbi:MAG: hypothetical protein CAF41_003950 [Nitrospira sp. CG24A]|nr:MAG: hypothetical protein CAF41_003950 [Nitrospira sp. CG24A]
MAYPREIAGAQICIRVSTDGMTVYGNRKAFKSLAQWMTWIANAPAEEHYECHLPWHLQSKSSVQGKESKNVWVVLDKSVKAAFASRDQNHAGFDLNFMAIEQSDLDRLRLRRSVRKKRK